MQASQQATMAAQQASQQAMQDMQTASQMAAQQANQMATDNMMSTTPCCGYPLAASPRFSVKAGSYTSPVTVRLSDRTRGAVIYYTTDGWTPTAASTRYTGPITISSTTMLEAVAIAPGCSGSLVAWATYTFPGSPQAQPPAEFLPVLPAGNGNVVLRLNAPVPLVFVSAVDSHTAQVGDAISFTLAEDLKAGDQLLAPKGTAAVGKVIHVDRRGVGGWPGDLVFQVDSLMLNGTPIPLHGAETQTGKAARNKARTLAIIPGIGISALLVRGTDAQIAAGATVTATMSEGTVLPVPGGPAN
jgi:hypothetical protein